jgi:hypothetical protein
MWSAALMAGLLCLSAARAQDERNPVSSAGQTATEDEPSPPKGKKSEQPMVRLKILVTGKNDKPVVNASVYVRYNVPGGLIHKDKLAELDLKTSQDGSVKVLAVPQGKILIQVIATGWHTYGKWYDIEKDEDFIEIRLDPPTHWY